MEWVVDTGSVLRLGAHEGEHPYRFHGVDAAFRLTDGRILIADGGTSELRYFDAEGRHIQTVGRRGGGPGEFVVLTSVVKLPGDTVLVHDIRSRRITTISPAGIIVHEANHPEAPTIWAGSLLGVLSQDNLAFRLLPPLGSNPRGYSRDTVSIAIAKRGSAILDTVLRIPSRERFTEITDGPRGRRSISHVHPFGFAAAAAVWNGDLVTSDQESYELRVLDSAARLKLMIRRADRERVQLDSRHVGAYLDAVTRSGYSAEAVRNVMDGFPGPRFVPAHGEIHVDDAGFLWVAEFEAPEPARAVLPRTWVVFDRTGRAVARASTPEAFEPLHIARDFIVGLVRDSLDVEYVQVHRVRR